MSQSWDMKLSCTQDSGECYCSSTGGNKLMLLQAVMSGDELYKSSEGGFKVMARFEISRREAQRGRA